MPGPTWRLRRMEAGNGYITALITQMTPPSDEQKENLPLEEVTLVHTEEDGSIHGGTFQLNEGRLVCDKCGFALEIPSIHTIGQLIRHLVENT